MNYPVLAERVHYFKDNVKGATNMCRAVETLVKENRMEAHEEGRMEERLDMIRVMMKNLGLTFEQAMKSAEIPESDWPRYRELLENTGK